MASTDPVWLAVGLALAALSACELEPLGGAGAVGDAGTDTGVGGSIIYDAGFGGAEAATPLPYAYRRRVTVTPGASSVPLGASLVLRFDHQALVLEGKARGDGKDLRLFFQKSGAASHEIDRVLDVASGWDRPDTSIWFRVQANIGNQLGGSYYLYYGNKDAQGPPEDPRKVYAIYDDFEGSLLSPEWHAEAIGGATGTFSVGGGVLRIEGATGDIWNNGDDFLFVYRPVAGNFVAEARVSDSGGSASGWAKLGGLMLRGSKAVGARNRTIAPVNGSAAITSSFRLSTDGATVEVATSGSKLIPQVVRLARRFDASRTWHSSDAVDYTELGTELSFNGATPDSMLIGMPLGNLAASPGWVELDWFRAWLWFDDEPSIGQEPEEPGPFFF